MPRERRVRTHLLRFSLDGRVLICRPSVALSATRSNAGDQPEHQGFRRPSHRRASASVISRSPTSPLSEITRANWRRYRSSLPLTRVIRLPSNSRTSSLFALTAADRSEAHRPSISGASMLSIRISHGRRARRAR